jgi:hypothetical protein
MRWLVSPSHGALISSLEIARGESRRPPRIGISGLGTV